MMESIHHMHYNMERLLPVILLRSENFQGEEISDYEGLAKTLS